MTKKEEYKKRMEGQPNTASTCLKTIIDVYGKRAVEGMIPEKIIRLIKPNAKYGNAEKTVYDWVNNS